MNQRLRTCRFSTNEFAIFIGENLSGWITRKHTEVGQTAWSWGISGIYVPERFQPSTGEADCLENAELQMTKLFNEISTENSGGVMSGFSLAK
jgi:hypothetical protein